jgi:hypothetical protein
MFVSDKNIKHNDMLGSLGIGWRDGFEEGEYSREWTEYERAFSQ